MRRRWVALIVLVSLAGLFTVTSAAPASGYPLGPGYWLAGQDGGVFSFGEAQFFGSAASLRLNKPISGAAAHPFLEGYWLVATDGGVFAFGSAGFFGSTGNIPLNKPIVGMAPTPTGLGYWLVASDGGVFTFGDAQFFGSAGDVKLRKPVVGMAPTPTGLGYWLVASDGGVFTYGDAPFFGSAGGIDLNNPVVGLAPTATGAGYWLVASDGGVFTYGDAPFLGSAGGSPLARPVLAMALRPPLAVKVDAFEDSRSSTPGSATSLWQTFGGDDRLVLTKNAGGGVPAGARVYGVEGLDASQLGTIGFTVESGPCSASAPMFALSFDADRNGAADGSRTFGCASGGSAATPSWDPVALGVPATAVVTALDILHGAPSTTAVLDDIRIAGLTVTGNETVRAP